MNEQPTLERGFFNAVAIYITIGITLSLFLHLPFADSIDSTIFGTVLFGMLTVAFIVSLLSVLLEPYTPDWFTKIACGCMTFLFGFMTNVVDIKELVVTVTAILTVLGVLYATKHEAKLNEAKLPVWALIMVAGSIAIISLNFFNSFNIDSILRILIIGAFCFRLHLKLIQNKNNLVKLTHNFLTMIIFTYIFLPCQIMF